jgi:hypothetical protein
VKTDNPEHGSIYRGKKEKPTTRPWAHLSLLLAALLVAHFLNLLMHWTVTRQELAEKPAYRTPEYTFLGFSLLNQEKIAAVQRLPNAAPSGRVFAFYDWLHPAVFLVWNNNKGEEFFDLGPLLVAVPAGASRVSLLPAGIFLLRQREMTVVKNYGGSILGSIWAGYWHKKIGAAGKGGGSMPGSFVVKQEEGAIRLKFPYLVYFYLPLLLILVLAATSGMGLAASFFYYAEMFFLFDFQKLFVTIPLAWLFNALGVELHDPWVKVLAVSMALLFLAASLYGLWRWKNAEIPGSQKWVVLFFILLPFSLFF